MFEFERFSHYLFYGANDQQTVRQLVDHYQGLIVPGTVAAFQKEGTGGFVLSLSAIPGAPPYLIDPRFPLFQKALIQPKKSHLALAELLGVPELVRNEDPEPGDFGDEVVKTIAHNWVEFNMSYEAKQAGKFKKYAKLLDEQVDQDSAEGPSAIIAPYLVSDSDDWWLRSEALMSATVEAAPSGVDVLRVIAASGAQALDSRLGEVEDRRVVVWVSDLKEIDVMPGTLADYGESIRAATRRGQSCFALYGGFFGVLLASIGLKGACHGIGYGEHRSWPELPQSGPPPSRYYAPRFHRYIGQDLAYQLWSRDADLTGCSCPICQNGPPLLDYHDLMKHSVFARQIEIESWAHLELGEACDRLRHESAQLESDLEAADLPDPLIGPVGRSTSHLSRWVLALDQLRGG